MHARTINNDSSTSLSSTISVPCIIGVEEEFDAWMIEADSFETTEALAECIRRSGIVSLKGLRTEQKPDLLPCFYLLIPKQNNALLDQMCAYIIEKSKSKIDTQLQKASAVLLLLFAYINNSNVLAIQGIFDVHNTAFQNANGFTCGVDEDGHFLPKKGFFGHYRPACTAATFYREVLQHAQTQYANHLETLTYTSSL